MAALKRFLKSSQPWRIFNSLKTLTSSTSSTPRNLQRRLYHRSFQHQMHPKTSESLQLRSVQEIPVSFSMFPAFLAGLFGAGLLEVSYADGNEAHSQAPLPSESPSGYVDTEKAARQECR